MAVEGTSTFVTLTLTLDAETLRRIEDLARSTGVLPSEIVRRALDQYQAIHSPIGPVKTELPSVFEILDRAGLIGCLAGQPGAPTDLATNPDHLDGFGRD